MRGLNLKNGAVIALVCGLAMVGCTQMGVGNEQAELSAKALSSENTTQAVLDAVNAMLPEGQAPTIDWSQPSALPGFHDVVINGDFLLVSNDGRYVIRGSAIDLQTETDIGEAALMGVRKRLLDELAPPQDRIVFAPTRPKYTVTVLTDISCGYCRRLHQQIDEYNQRGIAIEYIAYPRMGLGSDNDREMQSIWCASDRRQALTNAKTGGEIEEHTCDNPVERQYLLGQRLGLQGTPMMVTESGQAIHGYLPPEMLEQRLTTMAK